MAYNKVLLPDKTVAIDLTEDTVTKETLAVGATAHDKYGERIIGEAHFGEGGSSANLQENVIVQSTDVEQQIFPQAGYSGFAKVTVLPVITVEGEDMATYGIYIYKTTNINQSNRWVKIEGNNPIHPYKFEIPLPHETIKNDYLYLFDSIVLDTTENEGAKKAIFKTAQSLSGKKLTIYSDLDVDCKIILKGY